MFARRGPGLVGTAARTAVVVGVAGNMSHRQQQKYAAQDQQKAEAQQAQQAPPEPAAPAAPAEPDYAAELEKLAQLTAQGILTQEEFEAKKRQILGL